jgi:hypothetical protein
MLVLQGWEIGLLVVAGFIAVTALVRLMRARRDELTEELLRQAEDDQRRKQQAERKAKQKQRKAA